MMAGKNKIRGDCPYCGAIQKYCVFPATSTFFCYRCRQFGHLKSDNPALPLPFKRSSSYDPKAAVKTYVLDGFIPLKSSPTGIRYLKKREIDPLPLMNYTGTMGNYIVLPFYEKQKIVFYVKRKMWGKGRKHDNAPGKAPVFSPYGCLKTDRVVVTEGIFDCLKTYQATGIPTLALLGKDITPRKLSTILDWGGKKIDLLLDEDALITACIYYQTLKATGRKVTVKRLKGYKDPGAAPANVIRRILNVC